ncbi:MAG: hypothetical protein E7270_03440 [Lachnospiraceae bacterium]|nr:hypothetical protein [Lachnospiraceae bacterium]
MKIGKNIKWGIFFLVIAAFVIVGSMGYFGDVSVWTIVFSACLIMWFITGITHLSWGNILFPLALGAILFDEALGIEKLTPWPVLAAALFGTIGLSLIFKPKRKMNFPHPDWAKNGTVVEEISIDDMTFDCEVAFGSSVKYINCRQLRSGKIETSFGNAVLYFDNALLDNGYATIKVETSFGKTTLYIPKEWSVDVKVTKAFGSADEKGSCAVNSTNRLVIEGEVSFGSMEIVYI